MPTDLRNIISNLTNDADFRAWASAVHAQLVACGLVQTADTGQINFGTVNRPGAANTKAGYAIYRFDDALQATKPVFIKIEYGSGAAQSYGSVWITIGPSTNGAGTINNITMGPNQLSPQNAVAANLQSFCSGSAEEGRIALFSDIFATASNAGSLAFVIERTKDADGESTDDGYVYWANAGYTGAVFLTIPHTGAIPGGIANAPADPMQGQQSKVGLEVAMSPWNAKLGKALSILSFLTIVSGDIGVNQAFQAEHLGKTRTFIVPTDATRIAAAGLSSGGVAGRTLAMIWE